MDFQIIVFSSSKLKRVRKTGQEFDRQ